MLEFILILLSSIEGYHGSDEITPYGAVVTANVGDNVILSCNYSSYVSSLHWYRQYLRLPPQFLILEYSGSISEANPPVPGISVTHRKESTSLNISSAAVSDSAMYYCALRPTVTGNTATLGQSSSRNPETAGDVTLGCSKGS
uniref:Ig-like domain-containing protein n=1 Tax=Electrophorus electricus TaxID=8005 RepID=A0AAY5EUG8_ELEEL